MKYSQIFVQNQGNQKSPEYRLATGPNFLRQGQIQYCRFVAKSPELAILLLSHPLFSKMLVWLEQVYL